MSAPFDPNPGAGNGAQSAVIPVPTSQQDAAAWAGEQRRLTALGLIDLQAKWEQQPDLHVLSVGAGEQADQTIPGFPEDGFHAIAIYNPTLHALRFTFGTSSAAGAPMTVPPKCLLVWPAEYTNVTINSDTTKAAEQIAVLRLRYPVLGPTLEQLPREQETWSEEESATAGPVTLKLAGRVGRKIVVSSIVAQSTAVGAVGATKILEGVIRRGANVIFRFNLLQGKTAGAGEATDRFTSGPISLTLAEGEALTIEVLGAEANENVIVNASGYFQ